MEGGNISFWRTHPRKLQPNHNHSLFFIFFISKSNGSYNNPMFKFNSYIHLKTHNLHHHQSQLTKTLFCLNKEKKNSRNKHSRERRRLNEESNTPRPWTHLSFKQKWRAFLLFISRLCNGHPPLNKPPTLLFSHFKDAIFTLKKADQSCSRSRKARNFKKIRGHTWRRSRIGGGGRWGGKTVKWEERRHDCGIVNK